MDDTLYTRLADVERRLGNGVHYGVIEEADYAKARVKVRIGALKTAWLPFAAVKAGGDRSWHPPEIGEQVVLAAPGGDLSQACVLGSVYQNAAPAPGDAATQSVTVYEDGARISYDKSAHAYTLDVPAGGSITLRCGASTLILSDTGVVLTAPQVDFNLG